MALAFLQPARSQNPAGVSLLPQGFVAWTATGPGAKDTVVKWVPVTGQPFAQAIQVNTFNRPSPKSDYGLRTQITTPLHKGDVLWVSFQARSLESKRETGESFIELRFDQLVNGRYQWPSYLERGISIGSQWTDVSIPFLLTKDVAPEQEQFLIRFDSYPEKFELSPLTFINCGPGADVNKLPRSVVHYGGDAPDAAWRKTAVEHIEKYRKGDLQINVTDKAGKPVENAVVEVHQLRNAFAFGTATNSQLLLDSSAEAKTYRDTLLRYFNKVVLENEMKAKNWSRFNYTRTSAAVAWLKEHGLAVRGHVMVWPSWQNAGPVLSEFKNDTAALRGAILKIIQEQTAAMKGAFTEWDVVNEPYANHQFMDLLGRPEMLNWFKAARAGAPGVQLFLNEYTMFQTDTASQDFYNNLKYLIDHGAPLDAIGEQAHIGGTPPAIEKVLERLDKFSTFGLPIQISEFDINSDDDDFKAAYLRDFLTALYSHPSVMGFVQWGFWAGSHWFPSAALWDKAWKPRANGKIFAELVTQTWMTHAKGRSAKNGTYEVRGFTGDYEVIVKQGGKEVKKQVTVSNKGQMISIKL